MHFAKPVNMFVCVCGSEEDVHVHTHTHPCLQRARKNVRENVCVFFACVRAVCVFSGAHCCCAKAPCLPE